MLVIEQIASLLAPMGSQHALRVDLGPQRERGHQTEETRHGSTKGVFVTTSYFSDAALAFARVVLQQRIVLIDGEEFARLLVRHGIGVRTERTLELKRIDPGYFEDAEPTPTT